MGSWSPKVIHLASKYATTSYDTSDTSCGFQLSRPLTIPSEYEFRISVLCASIPYSFYGIPKPVTFTAGSTNAVIPSGNWSASDLASKLGQAWTATLSVTWTPQTGLFTFLNKTASPINILSSQNSTLLGLSTSANTIVPASGSVSSTYFPDIFGTRFVNVMSTLNTECITAGSTTSGSGVLASIPVNTNPNGMIIYMPNNLVHSKLKETCINNFDITLCDSNMVPLNMNMCDWEIDLLIECIIPIGEDQIYNENPSGLDLFSSVKGYKIKRGIL